MNKNKLRETMKLEGELKVYSEQELIGPISRLLQEKNQVIPIYDDMPRYSDQVIFNNLIEKYFLDFLGLDDSDSCIPTIMDQETGQLHKNYVKAPSGDRLTFQHRMARPVFKVSEDKSVGHGLFKGENPSDFVYQTGDLGGTIGVPNMAITPIEFFSKCVNTVDRRNDSEFMFVKYAINFKSNKGLSSLRGHQTAWASLENNVHYSKIKHIECDGEPVVYVENRRLTIINKRHFMNLTVNSEYYNNLLSSLMYSPMLMSPARNFHQTIFDKFENGRYWGTSYDLAFNSMRMFNKNPEIIDDISRCPDEEYLVFDSLDFSYNKNGDTSKSFAITDEGMYTIRRKDDGTISISSPRGKDKTFCLNDNLAECVIEATKPSFNNYHPDENNTCFSQKRLKEWADSVHRGAPIKYLFSSALHHSGILTEDLMQIRKSSIYNVLVKIYAEKIKLKDTIYKQPKNSSKLSLVTDDDAAQILADSIADQHNGVYKEFLRNPYKVTLEKLKKAFQYVPGPLVGTQSEYEKGCAVKIGHNMFVRLIDYVPKSKSKQISGRDGIYNILILSKEPSLSARAKLTVGWLLTTVYESLTPDSLNKNSQQSDESVNYVLNYVGDFHQSTVDRNSNVRGGYIGLHNSKSNMSPITVTYEKLRKKYAVRNNEFESSEMQGEQGNRKIIAKLMCDANIPVSCEPLLEPVQYKIVSKDSDGNVAYALIRPFISLAIDASKDCPRIGLEPMLPMHNLVFYMPVQTKDSRKVLSTLIYSNRNKELIRCGIESFDPLPRRTDVVYDVLAHNFKQNLSVSDEVYYMLGNTLTFSTKDLMNGSMSTEKASYMSNREYVISPRFSEAWLSVFKYQTGRFFDDYRWAPDILFVEVGKKCQKIKSGASIKNYFKGTSMEILRIDAWLGIRPADRLNLNLCNPSHWVNQRELFDVEFFLYMITVLSVGAYQLTTMVEAGMDTREFNYETYGREEFSNLTVAPHRRGPYAVAILNYGYHKQDPSDALSYFAGCFSTDRALSRPGNQSFGFKKFFDVDTMSLSKKFNQSTTSALMSIRDGEISTYADFVMASFASSLENKSKKEKKEVRNRLHKFLLSEHYVQTVAITASQLMIENIVCEGRVELGMLEPVQDLGVEIRAVHNKWDFANSTFVRTFRDIFGIRAYCDDSLNLSVYDIFKYIKSLVLEQRAAENISDGLCVYRDYFDDLLALKEYGDVNININNRKLLFPEAFKTQADIIRYNRRIIKDKEEMERFQKGSLKYKIMEYSNAKYTIRMAKSPLELQMEGDKLGHCVGSYAKSMGDGTNIIFFLRDRRDKDQPNVTVEFVPYTGSLSNVSPLNANFDEGNLEFVMTGSINQVQGSSRRAVNLEEAIFLNEWRSFVQDQMRKKINIIPSFSKRKKVKIKHEFIFGGSIQNQINNRMTEITIA